MIKLENVSKSYDGQVIIDNLSLTVDKENFVSIVGKSGSGKSTLLNMLSSLERPDSGSIYIDDKDITKYTPAEKALFRNKKIGFIFQSYFLEPTYNVFENVAVPLYISEQKNIEHLVEEVLKQVGMNEYKNKRVSKLSGGEQQRICIARALVNSPELILADEPCGNLDSTNSKIVMDILKSISLNGKKIIMVTHDEDDAALTERKITLSDGIIVSDEIL